MRLFLAGWDGGFQEMVDVALRLQQQSHTIVYWIRSSTIKVDASLFPEAVFHRHEDAMRCISPQGLDDSGFDFPDQSLIQSLVEAESTLLVMMNKRYEPMGIDERKQFYYSLLRYWYGALKKTRPDMVIFPAVPHTPYVFVIYSIAKLLGIRTVMFDFTRVNDRLLIMNDFVIGSPALLEQIKSMHHAHAKADLLSQDILDYYMKEVKRPDTVPSDVVAIVKRYSGREWLWLKLKALYWSIRSFTLFQRAVHLLFEKFWHNLKTEYQSVVSVPDFNKKYIYFPLHYQPECSTSPLGGVFVNQMLMIKTLSACLPKDWLLYVKEHPTQWLARGLGYLSHRYKGYYLEMAKLKNVRVMPIETNSYRLIYGAEAVATATGTAGWEAILRSKPALVFGYAWYRDCHGVFRIDGPTTCKMAIRKIVDGFVVDQQSVIDYLSAFDKASIRGYMEEYCKGLSTLSERENATNLLEAILSEIQKGAIPLTT
ncbi:MAG: hypothetical protein Q7R93_03290 [bacterium]|nr:hypothetical protein [bacterium]